MKPFLKQGMLWKGLLFFKDKGVSDPGMDTGVFFVFSGKGEGKDFNSKVLKVVSAIANEILPST